MERDRVKNKKGWAALFALLLLLAAGCSKEGTDVPPVPEVKYAKLTISLGSAESAEPVYTRAGGETVDPDVEEEKAYERYINEWWIVVEKRQAAGGYVVDQVVTNNPVSTNPGPNSETSTSIELEIGQSYKFYALANLCDLENGSAIVAELTAESLKGQAFSPASFEAQMKATTAFDDAAAKGETGERPYIPMSSYGYEQTITENPQPLKIPLIRLLGKVSVTVTNMTKKDITLSGLKMEKFRTSGNLFLFPYDVENGTQNLLATDIKDTYAPTFPGTEVTPAGTLTLFEATDNPQTILQGEGNKQTFTKYAAETNMQTDFMLTSQITGRTETPLATGFSFIRRNDWLRIPIQVTDVTTEITIQQQHMPIGGLPTNITFPEGAIIPIAGVEITHSGEIVIAYTVKEVSSFTTPVLKHWTGGEYTGRKYTSAVLAANTNDLLIHTPENKDAAPWLDTEAKAFTLTPGADNKSGSFSLTAQELAKEGVAEINLTLAIQEKDNTDDTKVLMIPYTIKIIMNKGKE